MRKKRKCARRKDAWKGGRCETEIGPSRVGAARMRSTPISVKSVSLGERVKGVDRDGHQGYNDSH